MKNVAILSDINSPWISCKSIKSNLIKSYKKIDVISYNSKEDAEYSRALCKIKENNISTLIFVDHEPIPYKLILGLSLIFDIRNFSFVFHIYGDFIFHIGQWQPTLNLLKECRVKLVCASQAQKNLMIGLIKNTKITYVAPFAIDQKEFFYSEKLRSRGIEDFSMDKNYKNIVYTGRISNQKNVIKLIDLIKTVATKFDMPLRLYIAGTFDDLGIPYLNKKFIPLLYQEQFRLRLDERIIYLGNLDKEKLNLLYNASDYYCSLSVHNDEDYGMAPAEALMTGLPCLLTEWGGFKSFQINTKHIETKIQLDSIMINEKQFQKILFQALNSRWSETSREDLANSFSKYASIDAVSSKLFDIIESNDEVFAGFKGAFENIGVSARKGNIFISNDNRYSEIYNQIYKGIYDSI